MKINYATINSNAHVHHKIRPFLDSPFLSFESLIDTNAIEWEARGKRGSGNV